MHEVGWELVRLDYCRPRCGVVVVGGDVVDEDDADEFADVSATGHVLEGLEPRAGAVPVQRGVPQGRDRGEGSAGAGDGPFGVDDRLGGGGVAGGDVGGFFGGKGRQGHGNRGVAACADDDAHGDAGVGEGFHGVGARGECCDGVVGDGGDLEFGQGEEFASLLRAWWGGGAVRGRGAVGVSLVAGEEDGAQVEVGGDGEALAHGHQGGGVEGILPGMEVSGRFPEE